jgi:hypothetical protein
MGVTTAPGTMSWNGIDWGTVSIWTTHLIECLQEHDVRGATFIDKDSVELDILDDGVDDERVPSRIWHKVWVVIAVEGDGDLEPL